VDRPRPRDDVSLLDVLVDGFERNEVMGGWHWRTLPLVDEESAIRRFGEFVQEATRWKGAPERVLSEPARRLAAWSDLEVRQCGRGILVRARAPRFGSWWHVPATWDGDPLGPVYDWIEEEGEGLTG
jgi:hypothetical protein